MIEGGTEFYELIQRLATNEDFSNATSRLPITMIEQRANEELVLRFFALVNARDGFRGNIEEWLDGYMEDILFKRVGFDFQAMEELLFKPFLTSTRNFKTKPLPDSTRMASQLDAWLPPTLKPFARLLLLTRPKFKS
ncbi:hypothetical protein ACFSZS_06250 [Seohaeicola zhoushanensis]